MTLVILRKDSMGRARVLQTIKIVTDADSRKIRKINPIFCFFSIINVQSILVDTKRIICQKQRIRAKSPLLAQRSPKKKGNAQGDRIYIAK